VLKVTNKARRQKQKRWPKARVIAKCNEVQEWTVQTRQASKIQVHVLKTNVEQNKD
jgi:hypothetical protein